MHAEVAVAYRLSVIGDDYDSEEVLDADTEYDLWLTTNNREVARQTVQEVIYWLESPEEGPLFCYDKCGDPRCVEDVKIDLVERIVRGLKERFK